MMKRSLLFRLGLCLALPALLFLGGCDAFSNNDDDDHDDHEEELARVELETRDGTGETVAVWTDDDGWVPDSLTLALDGDYAVWTVRMFTEDGDEFELEEGGEHEARYAVDSEASQEVIYFDASGEVEIGGQEEELFHGDHIHVYLQNAGTTRLRILLWHDNHADGDTDFIELTVEASGNSA